MSTSFDLEPLDKNRVSDAKGDTTSSDVAEVGTYQTTLPSFLRKLQYLERWLDHKLAIETQGVDRLPEDKKHPPSMWNMFLIWASFNVHAGSITLGVLGPEFGLSLHLTIAAAITGIAVGALGSAFNATLGPKTGLRQIACARFSFGMWGTRLCSVLNIIVIGGFFVTALIVMGELLSAVSDYKMNVTVGIVIVSVLAYVISVFGYSVIHIFEKYSWIMTFVLFLILIGQAIPHVDTSAPSVGSSDLAIAGAFMSVLAVNMSNGVGWSTIISDYMINYPATVPRWRVFITTYAGLVIFISFPVIVGAIVGNVAFANPSSQFFQIYEEHGLGGTIREIYHPLGWSKVCLVLLSFSALGNGVAVCYSAGLSAQLMGDYFRAVPRFLWSLIFIVTVAVISIVGKEHLSSIVLSLVSIVGYWAVAFVVILFLEDRVFRRHKGYALDSWNTQNELPVGVAAVLSLLTGYLAGGVPGMAQTWYVGPIAAKFGPYGGDVGLWLCGAITLVVYLISRPLETHFIGR